MQIEIPEEQYEKLVIYAQAAGYDGVPAFIMALAEGPTAAPLTDPKDKQLQQSLQQIQRSEEEIAAGKYHTLEAADQIIANDFRAAQGK